MNHSFEFFEVAAELIENGEEVSLPVAGSSMFPFLKHGRDVIKLTKPDGSIKKGDIMLFRRASGIFVLHRVIRVSGQEVYFCGDRQIDIEGPVPTSAVIAKVLSVIRNGKKLTENDFIWKVFRLAFTELFVFKVFAVKAVRWLSDI